MTTKEKAELMGKKVTVHKSLVRCKNKDKRRWEVSELASPFAGWIVGFTIKQNGIVGYRHWDEPSYFHATSSVQCALVRKWVNSKPIEVPLDGFELGGEPQPPKQNWTEKDRKWLSEESKNWPRDSKGRFIKEEKAAIK